MTKNERTARAEKRVADLLSKIATDNNLAVDTCRVFTQENPDKILYTDFSLIVKYTENSDKEWSFSDLIEDIFGELNIETETQFIEERNPTPDTLVITTRYSVVIDVIQTENRNPDDEYYNLIGFETQTN